MSKIDRFDDIVTTEGKSHVKKTKTEIEIPDVNIESIVTHNQNKKKRRELVSVYFNEDDMNKLKTLSMNVDSPISKIIEECMQKLVANTEVNDDKVKEYDNLKKQSNK